MALKLPGVNYYAQSIASFHEAHNFVNRSKRLVNPEGGDDVAEMRKNEENCRRSIYSAMTSLPEDASEEQKRQFESFERSMDTLAEPLKEIEAKSWIVADEVITLHEFGTVLRAKFDIGKHEPNDNNMLCSERVKRVIEILSYNKPVCLNLLQTHLDVLRFITAPNTFLALKLDAQNQRKKRKERVQQPQRHETPRSDRVPTLQSALRLPHKAPAVANPPPFKRLEPAPLMPEVLMDDELPPQDSALKLPHTSPARTQFPPPRMFQPQIPPVDPMQFELLQSNNTGQVPYPYSPLVPQQAEMLRRDSAIWNPAVIHQPSVSPYGSGIPHAQEKPSRKRKRSLSQDSRLDIEERSGDEEQSPVG